MKLRTENIAKSYKGRKVVKGVSIEVNQGEIVGLLGPNGAGKTTSFYMIVGLVSPNEGRVYLEDRDITKLAMYKRAEAGIGYLPQENSVFRKLSIEDNIMAVLELTKKTKAEREAKLEQLISEFGLGHVRTNLGQSLSGGERRRTEIARALATEPNFVLLDEPFAGVDPIAVEDIQNIVSKLKEKNIGVLITDHNVQETLAITDRTYLLFEGNILKQGTADELAADPMVRKVYLGENFELRKPLNKTEKTVKYINSMIKFCQDIIERVDNEKRNQISGDYRYVDLNINDLIKMFDEFNTYMVDFTLTHKVRALVNNLRFATNEAFDLDKMTTTIADLRLIKQLIEHPELEKEL